MKNLFVLTILIASFVSSFSQSITTQAFESSNISIESTKGDDNVYIITISGKTFSSVGVTVNAYSYTNQAELPALKIGSAKHTVSIKTNQVVLTIRNLSTDYVTIRDNSTGKTFRADFTDRTPLAVETKTVKADK